MAQVRRGCQKVPAVRRARLAAGTELGFSGFYRALAAQVAHRLAWNAHKGFDVVVNGSNL